MSLSAYLSHTFSYNLLRYDCEENSFRKRFNKLMERAERHGKKKPASPIYKAIHHAPVELGCRCVYCRE